MLRRSPSIYERLIALIGPPSNVNPIDAIANKQLERESDEERPEGRNIKAQLRAIAFVNLKFETLFYGVIYMHSITQKSVEHNLTRKMDAMP